MKLIRPVALVGLRRTHIGKAGGGLAKTPPHEILAACFRATLQGAEDAGLQTSALDDVVVGNLRSSVGNLGRVASLEAGVPDSVPAMTVDRQCASSLEALSQAACRVSAGLSDAVLVGGVESASRCPWMFEKTERPYAYFEPKPFEVLVAPRSIGNLPMGETAEILADEYGLTREEMDRFAVGSHRRAVAAVQSGRFTEEVCPLDSIQGDESVRPGTTEEKLAKLKPVFRKNGRLTAGNSSPLNDGAASCLVLSEERVAALGVAPDAHLMGVDTVGLDPNRMGLGPALSIPRILGDLGLTAEKIDLFEINEAFSSQILAVLRHLEEHSGIVVPPNKLNVNGGAIALGHPLGATGLRLIVTLVHALKQRNLNRGLASLCVGGGQGMSAFVEVG